MVFRLDGATVVRPTGQPVFRDISWEIRAGQTWAIVGPVGSGKTALTDVLLGRLRVTTGSADWPLVRRLAAAFPSDVIGRVAFKEESRLFSYGRHYYQQRFNFIEPDDDLTLEAFLRAGTNTTDEHLAAVATRLGIGHLRPLSLIKLSNGQTRRARIAKALLGRPAMLVLDEPFIGLDADGRREVAGMLHQLRSEGVGIVLITHPDTVPEWVTDVLELDQGRVIYSGPRAGFSAGGATAGAADPGDSAARSTDPVIELRAVSVVHGGRTILDRIDWTVRAGERWAVLGPNGAGKTTLLSLICGDHPQAYSNDVSVFGRRRGTGESIWDVKQQIGLVSPELHLYFSEPLTASRAAATGFFDVLVPRPTTPEQDAAVRELFAFFEIADLADRPFGRLSTGQQRIVLLVRALVKDPPLLILDEPFQVLDARTTERARTWIDDRLAPDRTVLFVTHREQELPRTVTRRLRLRDGRVTPAD
ncbi:MAG TPA: ATP-binding cassette domain-containing protein [Gemmataceae bacterium]|nr:ATP-binding cassette domain-containing protein [Gemmataceae bacterium]